MKDDDTATVLVIILVVILIFVALANNTRTPDTGEYCYDADPTQWTDIVCEYREP